MNMKLEDEYGKLKLIEKDLSLEKSKNEIVL